LLHAIRIATAGDALLDPGMSRRLTETYVQRAPAANTHELDSLTMRERDRLQAVIYGYEHRMVRPGTR
jgi:hypothetical protein